MEPMEIVQRRQIALRLAMDFLLGSDVERDEKRIVDIAKRFDHFLSTGSQGRDRTLTVVSESMGDEAG